MSDDETREEERHRKMLKSMEKFINDPWSLEDCILDRVPPPLPLPPPRPTSPSWLVQHEPLPPITYPRHKFVV